MRYLLKGILLLVLINFTTAVLAETKVYFSPDGGCQAVIVEEIGKARKSIEIAMYSFTSREIAQALVSAKERHVDIKIDLDIAQIKDPYSKKRYLIHKGLDVKFHMGPGLMHNKFAIIDDRTVLTGSFNWTATAERKNAENLLVITDKKIAQKYAKQFRHLWTQSGEGELKESKQGEKTNE